MNSASNHSVKGALLSLTNFTPAAVPLSHLQSGQFLALTAESEGGLIIQKGFWADFVGPGAAVGGYFDIKCTAVYTIGKVQFCAPQTYAERQQAFQKRIAYMDRLQQITAMQAPLRRGHLIVHQLVQWVGVKELKEIPLELIARLVGVYPKTVAIVRQHCISKKPQEISAELDEPTLVLSCD